MNLESALAPDSEAKESASAGVARTGPTLVGTHTQRVAALFRDEYPKLVHYMVSKTGSWPEARDVAAQAFAQVLEMRAPDTISFLKAYVYRAARNLALIEYFTHDTTYTLMGSCLAKRTQFPYLESSP